MKKQENKKNTVPVPGGPFPRDAVNTEIKTEKQTAEAAEVDGRHRNSGQKDHKGAR